MWLVLALAACWLSGAVAERSVKPIPNPHAPSSSSPACLCPAQTIAPDKVLFSPAPLQAGSSLGVETIKVGKVGVPVYLFKQPRSLSELELPFKIILQSSLPLAGLYDLPVDDAQASNSWFEGYRWSVLLCDGGCQDGAVQHVGWHFTSIADPAESFYALIVKTSDEQKSAAGAVFTPEAFRKAISVGMPAPAWMLALMTTSGVAARESL